MVNNLKEKILQWLYQLKSKATWQALKRTTARVQATSLWLLTWTNLNCSQTNRTSNLVQSSFWNRILPVRLMIEVNCKTLIFNSMLQLPHGLKDRTTLIIFKPCSMILMRAHLSEIKSWCRSIWSKQALSRWTEDSLKNDQELRLAKGQSPMTLHQTKICLGATLIELARFSLITNRSTNNFQTSTEMSQSVTTNSNLWPKSGICSRSFNNATKLS